MEKKQLGEIWKPIIGYENFYEVSNLGQIRSKDTLIENKGSGGKYIKKGCVRKHVINHKTGYHEVMLSVNNKIKNILVHRMVAIAFIPNPNNYETVNHLHGDKDDNSENALEWLSQSKNNKHSFSAGLKKPTDVSGKKNPRFKHGKNQAGSEVKECKMCGKLFMPRINKQILCSVKCRGSYNNLSKYKTHNYANNI